LGRRCGSGLRITSRIRAENKAQFAYTRDTPIEFGAPFTGFA
jgi:hypothetical protein